MRENVFDGLGRVVAHHFVLALLQAPCYRRHRGTRHVPLLLRRLLWISWGVLVLGGDVKEQLAKGGHRTPP